MSVGIQNGSGNSEWVWEFRMGLGTHPGVPFSILATDAQPKYSLAAEMEQTMTDIKGDNAI